MQQVIRKQHCAPAMIANKQCGRSSPPRCRSQGYRLLTVELGLSNNLAEELSEVWQVLAQEAGFEDNGLAGVVGSQLAAEEFGFASKAESRALDSVLDHKTVAVSTLVDPG